MCSKKLRNNIFCGAELKYFYNADSNYQSLKK